VKEREREQHNKYKRLLLSDQIQSEGEGGGREK
jgi:hypothetical protein